MRTLTEYTAEQQYADMLDEVYGTVTIAGLTFDTGRALKELDPTAFRCGMLDWADTYGIEIGDEDQDEDTDESDDEDEDEGGCCEAAGEWHTCQNVYWTPNGSQAQR